MKDPITRDEFESHCEANLQTDKKLDKLMPLANLIPIIEEIVESQKFQTQLSKKIARGIGVFALVVSIIAGVLASIKYFFDIKK